MRTSQLSDIRKHLSDALALISLMLKQMPTALHRISVRLERRPVIACSVAVFHIFFVYLLVVSLGQKITQKPTREMILSLNAGGPRQVRGEITKPTLIVPNEPVVNPPTVSVDDPPMEKSILASIATGGPGVTLPAEAIGATRTVPPLSVDLLQIARRAILRLRLSIDADGSIVDAIVENSSGSNALDQIALSWVKSHWRYRPAMRGGIPVAVTTTSLVQFQ